MNETLLYAMSYEWLFFLIIIPLRYIEVVASINSSFLVLLLPSIPWDRCNHNLFHHSLVREYLNCFQFWTTTNKATRSNCIQFLYEYKFSFFSNKYPRVQLLHCMVSTYLVLLNCSPGQLYHVTFILSSNVWRIPFLCLISRIWYCHVFFSYFNICFFVVYFKLVFNSGNL